MQIIFWQEFAILYAASLLGAMAVIPYSLRMTQGKSIKVSKSILYLAALAQSAVLFGAATFLGLLASHSLGLGAPFIEAMLAGTNMPLYSGLGIGLLMGIILGAVLLIADFFFVPYWPQKLREVSLATTTSENLLAAFYGGIDEELLLRLFALSGLAWLLSFFLHLLPVVLWIANIITTILFGLGHLPALKQMLGTVPRSMVIRSLLLNAPVGLGCGWLFWTYGIESAIIAHFTVDIVYHVFGTFILRKKLG
jgi:hypothetical protein